MATGGVSGSQRQIFTKEKSETRKAKCSPETLNEIFNVVFPAKKENMSPERSRSQISFMNLENHVSRVLSTQGGATGSRMNTPSSSHHKPAYMKVFKQKFVHTPSAAEASTSSVDGRLGVTCDVGLQSHPLDTVPGDNLAVIGNTNFQSVKASHCVYKGKWIYEVLLGTAGLMQVGWCTLQCKFSREEGVGDTKESYAFDGYRKAKWNARISTKYGKSWEVDDVVTCMLDLDNRVASFALNGVDMGVAFNNIPTGPGIAYFPGLSLAFKEVAYCNFGHRPLKYPVAGYKTLQAPPPDSHEADYLTHSLKSLHSIVNEKRYSELDQVTVHTMLAHIMQRLGPTLKSMYNVESYFLPFLLSLCDHNSKDDDKFTQLHFILSCLWQYTEAREVRDCMNNVFEGALRRYRTSPVHVEFIEQRTYLNFVLGLHIHTQTRRSLALHCTFDRQAEIPSLFHIKQVSKHREAGLSQLIPMVWGQDCDPKATYERGYEKLKEKMDVIKDLQREIMRLMLLDGNSSKQPKGYLLNGAFVKYFRKYLESLVSSTRSEHTLVCPPIVLHSFMQRLCDVTKQLWDELSSTKANYVSSDEANIPVELFYTETVSYFDLQRVGGLKSHLFQEHKDELAKEGVSVVRGRGSRRSTNDEAAWSEHSSILQLFHDEAASSSLPTFARADDDSEIDSLNPVLRLARALLSQSNKMSGRERHVTVSRKRSLSEDGESSRYPTKAQLMEITDGCILLYNNILHTHMDKIHSTRTKIVEYATALNDIETKMKKCSEKHHEEVRKSLTQSHNVLLHHMTELCRSIAWLKASVYSPESQSNLWWLLQVCLRTAHNASDKGPLFTFMPEFYLTAGARLYKCLREYFAPSQPFEKLPNMKPTLISFTLFLSNFHCDARLVNNDVKTMLANTITTFITYPLQLQAIEDMPTANLHSFVRNMLYAYDEDKPWTSVGHRILATLWRGSGFAMRYDHPPYMTKVKKLLNREHDPYVPKQLLACVQQLLLAEPVLAGKFVHSILEHLNWSFSEFIGQLQEVQQQNAREWNNATGLLASLDAQALRQLRIVDMLFELSVSLMRVLELTIAVAPNVFLDWEKNDTAEILLTALVQCVNQILSRVTTRKNLFDKIVSGRQPGLSSVQHYPLMTSTAGILLRMLKHDDPAMSKRATQALISDPGFSITSIEFLLNIAGKSEVEVTSEARGPTVAYSRVKERKFVSLQEYEELMDGEVDTLRDVIINLRHATKAAEESTEEPMDEDSLCTICYANEANVAFHPCKHTSCRMCIKFRLMSGGECFFCKETVECFYDLPPAVDAGTVPLDGATASTSTKL
ncbi:E3 ubiquitin-protein ligase RNF123 [Ciona intestinalis]